MSEIGHNTIPELALGDGGVIPQLGFGVFQVPPDQTTTVVSGALEAGYRHIDTAAGYGNEAEVAEAIERSDLDRSEVFVTTKLANDSHGYDNARRAIEASLKELGFDYVDLYLIHWPMPAYDKYVETWKALIEFREEGLAKSIGVSNFQPAHLTRIVAETGVTPSVNQIELHPRLQQGELRRLHAEMGILTEAWSPLMRGGAVLGEEPVLTAAAAHEKTPAQVVLRWHLQLGNVTIPRSVTPSRIEENLDLFDFELTPAEMEAFSPLETGERVGPNPDTFGP
jgi:2,5-diketo-D-gluconate reductase A